MIIEADEDAGAAARVAEGFAAAGIGAHRVALPDTQASKSFQTAEYLADALADHAIHRGDPVIAVGGEAICDIAGFVAATFNRGMRLCLVPTTLAAQADSAVGGKNAINLALGRTWWAPSTSRRRDQRHRGGLRERRAWMQVGPGRNRQARPHQPV